MENVISKGRETRIAEYLIKNNIMVPTEPDMTLEEILEICPFTRMKYEQAKATLERCPFPKELLLKK
ncbi:hypothetical protein [Chitinophaga filiformis]|uniref:Uncharacterized protein n=1 Tax=Chitinophaga filiformis TaxID=104663 RepID=A0A1G8CFL7_CHIFI|nr:hypothetical protein [Chitinophaga filiformis]SDH44276.1 hypothetical protein SAMN04488121_112128 [Chitinophaga filiformis]